MPAAKETRSAEDLRKLLVTALWDQPDCKDVAAVDIVQTRRGAAHEPNWQPKFIMAGSAAAPRSAFDLARTLQDEFDLS